MDWLFLSQLAIFFLYSKYLYNTYKSGVGNLKKDELYKSKFWTKFYIVGIVLGMGLGMLGGLVILFSFQYIFENIENAYFFGIHEDWKMLVFFIFIASFIFLITITKKKKDNNEDLIKVKCRYTANNILAQSINYQLDGYISIEDLRNIIEKEKTQV